MEILFEEKQRFDHWILWFFLIGLGLWPIYAIYKQLVVGDVVGSKPMSDVGLIVFACCVFCFITLFVIISLSTKIDREGIEMKFHPFVKKDVKWQEIQSLEIVNYGFVGGWGIRLGTRYGTIYNVKGKTGLAIKLKNGSKFLIGTQKESELEHSINLVKQMKLLGYV